VLDRARVDRVWLVGVADRFKEAAGLVEQVPGVLRVQVDDNDPSSVFRVTLDPQQGDPSVVARDLVAGGFALTKLTEEKVDLEKAFMRLTRGLVQ